MALNWSQANLTACFPILGPRGRQITLGTQFSRNGFDVFIKIHFGPPKIMQERFTLRQNIQRIPREAKQERGGGACNFSSEGPYILSIPFAGSDLLGLARNQGTAEAKGRSQADGVGSLFALFSFLVSISFVPMLGFVLFFLLLSAFQVLLFYLFSLPPPPLPVPPPGVAEQAVCSCWQDLPVLWCWPWPVLAAAGVGLYHKFLSSRNLAWESKENIWLKCLTSYHITEPFGTETWALGWGLCTSQGG